MSRVYAVTLDFDPGPALATFDHKLIVGSEEDMLWVFPNNVNLVAVVEGSVPMVDIREHAPDLFLGEKNEQ